MRNSKFELQKSRYTETETFTEKYRRTAVYKVDIITEKLSSKIGIAGSKFEKGSRGTKIFIFYSKKSSSTFSAPVEITDFCEMNENRLSPGRLEFQGHASKIVWGSKFLIKKNSVI
jgi:hypothetical protein